MQDHTKHQPKPGVGSSLQTYSSRVEMRTHLNLYLLPSSARRKNEKRRAAPCWGSCKDVNLSECWECRNSTIFTLQKISCTCRKLAAPVKREILTKLPSHCPSHAYFHQIYCVSCLCGFGRAPMQDIAIPGISPLNHRYPIPCSWPALNHSTLRVRELFQSVMSTAVKQPGPPVLHTQKNQQTILVQHICWLHQIYIFSMYWSCIERKDDVLCMYLQGQF